MNIATPLPDAPAPDAPAPDAPAPDAPAPNTPEVGADSYLLFRLQGSLCAVEAVLVREILALPQLCSVDESAPTVLGVLNLRGEMVPVIDLGLHLGRAPLAPNVHDSLVVVESRGTRCGFVVSHVLDVRPIAPAQQHDAPARREPGGGFVRAIAPVEEGEGELAMLLNTESLIHRALEPGEGHKYLRAGGGIFAGGFAAGASAEERATLAERARRLSLGAQREEDAGLLPFAVVRLGGERFGIALGGVRELCQVRHASPVPCCPPHIAGQMNLRGDILTLLDIRSLLRLPAGLPTSLPASAREQPGQAVQNQVVVVECGGMPAGILVDEVLDVLYLRPSAIDSAPRASAQAGGQFFSGGAPHGGEMLCLLDVPGILGHGGLVVDEAA